MTVEPIMIAVDSCIIYRPLLMIYAERPPFFTRRRESFQPPRVTQEAPLVVGQPSKLGEVNEILRFLHTLLGLSKNWHATALNRILLISGIMKATFGFLTKRPIGSFVSCLDSSPNVVGLILTPRRSHTPVDRLHPKRADGPGVCLDLGPCFRAP